jgi:hypothetical protein
MNTLDRYSSTTALLLVVLTFGIAAFVAAAGRTPDPTVAPTPALSYIMVMTTPVPTSVPTADTQVQRELAELRSRVAELEQERSAPGPQAVYQQMAAPQATPYVADPQMTYSESGSTVEISVPTDAPRLCDGFGDWRDFDSHYADSPACHKATP